MAENVTNELILEHLKAIQSKLIDHDNRFSSIENKLSAVKAHVAGLVQTDLTRDSDYATLALRIDRIERRLELSEN